MTVPSLQRLTILSFVFHITFFGVVLFVLKQSARIIMPSPYVVNLVESDIKSEINGAQAVNRVSESEVPKKEEVISPRESARVSKRDERQLEEKIAAMEAKKKIARIARLKNELRNIIPLKGSVSGGKTGLSHPAKGRGDAIAADYYSKVHQQIWNKWGVPREMKEKKLEAIVSIRIMRNGSVQIIGVEQKSGDPVFDRSALVAIKDASPLPPPPYEMEMGIRFYP